MQKISIIFLCIITIFSLIACNSSKESNSNNQSDPKPEYDYGLAQNVQDGVILHAWNWSYNTIKENLKNIAEAGFSTVQTSPVQQPKSYNKDATSVDMSWWKLYQPVSFSVGDAWLGTKEELTSLCSEAKKYGIKIIVDIVVNHMGNGSASYEGYANEIAEYEPEVYNNPSKYFRPYEKDGDLFGTNDANAETVTQGSLSGLPDLNTQDSYVQSRVKSLLKECIDCGVDGFRFDAAKHIETPDDGDYKSDFWPNILGYAEEYAKNTYKRDIYAYGEILNTPGGGRKISSYTTFMKVTDNNKGETIGLGVATRNYNQVYGAVSNYSSQLNAEDVVLWAESHDTFMSQTTKMVSTEVLNRTWSIVGNRAGATALYFARPGTADMGDCGNYNWMSQEVVTINKFHNYFIGASEKFTKYSYNSNNFIVNIRTNNETNESGVVITRISGTTKTPIKVEISGIPTGKYYDHISGNEFTVTQDSAGKLYAEGICNESGIIVLYNKDLAEIRGKIPELTYSSDTNHFYAGGSTEIRITAKNSENTYYQINGGEKIPLPEGGLLSFDEACELKVTAEGYVDAILNISIGEAPKRDGYWCIGGVSETMINSKAVYAWVWGEGSDGSWRNIEYHDGYYYIKQESYDYGMLLAYFELGTTIEDASWDLAPAQTEDLGKPLDDNFVYTAK